MWRKPPSDSVVLQCWLHSHDVKYPVYPGGDETGLVSSYQNQVSVGCRAESSGELPAFICASG